MRYEWSDPLTIYRLAAEKDSRDNLTLKCKLPDQADFELLLFDYRIPQLLAREFFRLAEENRALKAESEEYQLFGGELVGRLGLDREEMEGKPDSVGNQILAILDERTARLAALEERVANPHFDRIAADRLADEVAALVTRRKLDARSPAADALLDYRGTPRTERSDRIAVEEGVEIGMRDRMALAEKVDSLEEENRQLREANERLRQPLPRECWDDPL